MVHQKTLNFLFNC